MKTNRFILLFVLCCSFLNIASQEYKNVFEDGKIWNYEYWPYSSTWQPDYEPKQAVRFVEGDTIINGRTCKKLYEKRKGSGMQFAGAFYETGGKVYRMVDGMAEDLLIYDFTAEEGDCFVVYDYYGSGRSVEENLHEVTVKDIQTKNIRGRNAKCIFLTFNAGEEGPFETIWIEGIGSNCGESVNLGTRTPGNSEIFTSCYLSENCLYLAEETFPNNIENILMSTYDNRTTNDIYDLMGRRLNGAPAKGFYIQNGKKYVR